MGNSFAVFTVMIILLYGSVKANKYTHDYCWRDFNGVIPDDAFLAGMGSNDREMYIGQVLHGDKIIPGKIYKGENKIYYEFNFVEISTYQNVKILCSKSKNTFEWIPTENVLLLNLLPDRTLIKGGFEATCKTFLGRITKEQGSEVGKVMCCQGGRNCHGLYITTDGAAQLVRNFDILAYSNNTLNGMDISTDDRINVVKPVNNKKEGCKKITLKVYC